MNHDELEPMSDSMRALLDAERPLDTVPGHTRTKLYQKLKAGLPAVGVAAGVAVALKSSKAAAAATSGGATAGAVGTTTALTTKVLIAAVAFSAGGGVGAGVHSAVVTRRQAVAQVQPIVLKLPAPPAPELPAEPNIIAVEPESGAPQPVPKVQPKRADTLGAERSLVEQARAALSRHDVNAAIEVLNQHERAYPNGQLGEERLALQVIAHADLGETGYARELAAKFRAKHKDSLLMPAVDAASPP